jgi:hypothetical protein
MANVFPFLIDVNLPAVHVPYKTVLSGEVFANGKNTLNPPFRGCNVGRILYSPAFESAEVWRATEPGEHRVRTYGFQYPHAGLHQCASSKPEVTVFKGEVRRGMGGVSGSSLPYPYPPAVGEGVSC